MPGVLLIIPQYLLMSRLHLIDSLNGLVLIYVSQNLPFSIFLLRGFFEAIPREFEESFRVEGAGNLRVLTRLIAPLSVPALATVAMFTFNAAWDEFLIALTLINTPSHRTLPIGLAAVHRRAHHGVGAALRRLGDRHRAERPRLRAGPALVPARRLARRAAMTHGPVPCPERLSILLASRCACTDWRRARSVVVARSAFGRQQRPESGRARPS